MSPELSAYLAFLIVYLIVAAGIIVLVWRFTRVMQLPNLRLTLRAFAISFLLAPGVVACGGAALVPFSLAVVSDIADIFSPNSCGPYTANSLLLFFPVLVVVTFILHFMERRRRRVDVL